MSHTVAQLIEQAKSHLARDMRNAEETDDQDRLSGTNYVWLVLDSRKSWDGLDLADETMSFRQDLESYSALGSMAQAYARLAWIKTLTYVLTWGRD